MRIVVLGTSDIGNNFRLLKMIKSFSSFKNTSIDIIGPEITGFPRQLKKVPNVHVHETIIFGSLFHMNFVLFPLILLLTAIQVMIIGFRIRSVDLVLVSTYSVLDVILGFVSKLILKAKLAVDIMPFHYVGTSMKKEHPFASARENIGSHLADVRIVSNKAMQVLLKVRGYDSILIRDVCNPMVSADFDYRSQFAAHFNIAPKSIIVVSTDNLENVATALDSRVSTQVNIFSFAQPKQKIKTEHVKIYYGSRLSSMYRIGLSIADFGICLNQSASPFEVRRDVLEMRASEIPVLALQYGCIKEYIEDGVNGFLFRNEEQLLELLVTFINERKFETMTCTYQNTWNDDIKELLKTI